MECFLISLTLSFLIYRIGITIVIFQKEETLNKAYIQIAAVNEQK